MRTPKRRNTKNANARGPVPPRVIRAGWVLGPELNRLRLNAASDGAAGYRGHQGPQHRRGHLRLYWTGKGRTTPEIKFVRPYWTHADALTDDGPGIIVPVK